jgi:Protein of unknown function (DUF3017)
MQQDQEAERVEAGAEPVLDALAEPTFDVPAEPALDVPAEPALDVPAEPALDVRAVARASLAAGRSPSLWWTCAGIAVSVALVVTSGVPAGALALAGMIAAAGLARALMPDPGPVAFAVRSRSLDVTTLLLLAVSIGVLSQIIPTR